MTSPTESRAAGPVPDTGMTDLVALYARHAPDIERMGSDALPLLLRARSVELVIVDPRVGEIRHGELPGADIAAHLARHGLRVEVASLPREGASAGEAILRRAREVGAQLLVAGGYGHSRAREQVFGGVTRRLFEHAEVPVLFSH